MEKANQITVKEFIFLGFSSLQNLQVLLFVFILSIYMLSLMENFLIIIIVLAEPLLHTPMYLFLGKNSFLEIWYTSITVPKLLANFLSRSITITVNECVTQYYFFSLGATYCFLLAVMAFDHYLAICSPLRYTTVMNHRLCFHLSTSSWVGGFLSPLLPTILISQLSFYGPQKINHFFCDSDPIFKLSCSDIYIKEAIAYSCNSVVILSSFSLIMSSYVNIIANIVKLTSAKTRKKTFSTCASHLTVVTIYYGTIIFTYVRPPHIYYFGLGKKVSVFYCVITLLLNPLIYTLTNKDVKKAIWKSFTRMRR
ncbi:olfactory receptor 11L1-like [Gopherus flavomarginatus]|uniref:olfactory receptor 11L1-like n=1 Tax=Gopherus flavomarginatus TaxID=286002 RepID=UPI0021CC28C2|nr:olfactory receptor 11L1-like [Gopherus flavomarginatus]